MQISTMLRRLLTFFSFSFICLYSALSFATELENAAIYQQPRPIVPFSLEDTTGKPFTNQNLQGHWSLLFFGFTNCAMICPTTMTELNKMYGLLEKDKLNNMPQIVFISVDPERDSIKRIHDYVRAFNPAFVGATGSEQELTKLSKQLGVMYMKVRDKADPKHYAIDHSAFIVLVNPKGQAYGLLTTPHSAKNLAYNYRKITA